VSLAVNRQQQVQDAVSTTCAVRTRIVAAQVWIISDQQELTSVNADADSTLEYRGAVGALDSVLALGTVTPVILETKFHR
jgi:hypothetical protein